MNDKEFVEQPWLCPGLLKIKARQKRKKEEKTSPLNPREFLVIFISLIIEIPVNVNKGGSKVMIF